MNPLDTTKLTRAEQARINGAKSKGPITPEGRAKSSVNALKHGFAAKVNVLIGIDDPEAWKTHLDGYRASFHPTNLVESDLVDQLAAIAWRQARLVGLETALIDFQLSIQADGVEQIHPDEKNNGIFHLVLAWQALDRKSFTEPVDDPSLPPNNLDIQSIELLRRYQVSLDRQYRNTMLNLRQYRKDFAAPAPAPVAGENEPKPQPPPLPAAEANEPNPQQPQPITVSTAGLNSNITPHPQPQSPEGMAA